MKNFATKVIQMVLVFALVVTSVVVTPDQAKAATNNTLRADFTELTGDHSAKNNVNIKNVATGDDTIWGSPYQCISFDYTVSDNMSKEFVISANQSSSYLCLFFNSTAMGSPSDYVDEYDGNLVYDYSTGKYEDWFVNTLANGQYKVMVFFDSYLTVSVKATTYTTNVSYKCTEMAPYAKYLTQWKSSNTAIATVDQTGKITGKKIGSCYVSCVDKSGYTYRFPVKVVKNERSVKAPKKKKNDIKAGITKLAYDKKGNLLVTVTYVNGYKKNVKLVGKGKFTVKAGNGKTVCTFKDTKKRTIKANKSLKVTYTVKKKSLKIKTADLRKASCNGTYKFTK